MASRTALASPAPVTATTTEYEKPTSSRRRHEAPVAPPRTSSTQHEPHVLKTLLRVLPSGLLEEAVEQELMAIRMLAYLRITNRARTQNEPGLNNQPMILRTCQTMQGTNVRLFSQPEVDLERERERQGEARPHPAPTRERGQDDAAAPPPVVHTNDAQDETRRGGRSRHDHSKREKSSRFGDYFLGNTIGEGEFGKVKLGWKQDGGVQVAIKLIRRDSVGNNPTRLAKIYREVSILRGLSHPNIVRLHEMSETERHIGIILEYASGGELFDYILTHRYLKDHAARRLFAQLISGVGYLHKKGIVHRDLKLENLLLDRNRNIIITDFGFANTFDASDELTEEEELNLPDRDFVKRTGLDKTKPNELVVSDSLYTGRKVDVWSCGVILYAMLAGYLPFDDDPDNPEGDNINLLYKYIVNTPLTFPEYVTPHARDLLRRILVPSPRKRADLFEVARHSWLSEYAHVVELITSTTTTSSEIQNTTVPSDEVENQGLARSASVREPTKAKATTTVAVGDLARKQGKVDTDESANPKQQRDNKRRTVQVEYVAPTTQTQRGAEQSEAHASPRGKAKAKSSGQGCEKATKLTSAGCSSSKSEPRAFHNGSSIHDKCNWASSITTCYRGINTFVWF
ncbi:hypothetical protein ONZ43_g4172 [Nemania bipapillata]|uniref:Uncharacterized protein n=1 Tax=Nemania bipapillata TaxID=110536 RepID=A0ACC2IR27_9PEZI|nr:hypothetical protein ONZ43_g4172 [Nemania bipapillata]